MASYAVWWTTNLSHTHRREIIGKTPVMSSERRHRGYFDTNYDKATPVAEYLRDRNKVNIAFFPDQMPAPQQACKYCHEQLIPVDNGLNLFCQSCGLRTPTSKAKQQKKLVQKHGTGAGPSNPIVVSQPETAVRSRQPGSEMSEELREELEEKGYHPE